MKNKIKVLIAILKRLLSKKKEKKYFIIKSKENINLRYWKYEKLKYF